MAGSIIRPLEAEQFPLPGTSANVPNDLSEVLGAVTLADDEPTRLQGALTSKPAPTEAVKPDITASIMGSFFDDYYNQIWVIPASIDFGVITSQSSKTFTIWNAYLEDSQSLLSIFVANGTGLSLSGPTVPAVFDPMGHRVFTVTAFADGPTTVTAAYRMVFSNGQEPLVPVSGIRAKLWPFPPNWAAPYKIGYEYKTEILTSRSGREQRIAHRRSPRKTLSHSVLLSASKLRRFNELMWSWQDRGFIMPEVTRKAFSESGMDPLSDHMDVSAPVPDWLKAGVTVVLDDNLGRRDIRVVENVSGQRVTFKSQSEPSWPPGTTVYYGVTGYFSPSVAAARSTSNVAKLDLTFNVDPLSEPPIDAGTPSLVIGGREIFDKRPNWAKEVAVSHQHEVEELDYGYGPVSRFSPIRFGTMLRQHTYLARDASEAGAVLQFFARNLGQQGEFYAPTWEHDVIPKIPAGPTTTSLRVAGQDFYDAYGSSTVNRGLAIRFNDGTMIYRLIHSVSLVNDSQGSDSLITVTQTWGREVSSATVQFVSWMLLWRLASDSLSIEFLSDTVAQFQLTMMSLEVLSPET